jgi:hypothetical protein
MASSKLSSQIAEIRYYTNYSDPSARVIRLGAVAEAVTDKTLVLAMLGRAALTADELASVSGFNRAELEDVWGMLSRAFQNAWAHRPAFDEGQVSEAGSMLRFLADNHAMSLHFETPRRLRVPRQIAQRVERDPKALGDSVLRLLEARLAPPKKGRPKVTARRSAARPVLAPPRARFKETANTEAVAHL